MQIIYRKAIDADAALDQLQQSGKGKFSVIFSEESGFVTRSKRFGPYVDELALNITQLDQESAKVTKDIAVIVKKMELLLVTIGKLKVTL